MTMVPVWRITPDITGMGYDRLIIPWGWESRWGLMEWLTDWFADAPPDPSSSLEIELIEMPLSELLDLEIETVGYLADSRFDREKLEEEYGIEEVRAADAERPSGARFYDHG